MFGSIANIGVQEQIPIGYLYRWGNGGNQELTSGGSTSHVQVPTKVSFFPTAYMRNGMCGFISSNIIKQNGKMYVLGNNAQYGTGLNTNAGYTTTWTQVGTSNEWKYMEEGTYTGIALKHNGTLWSWGYSNEYETGQNTTTAVQVPTQVGTDTDWRYVSCNCYHSAGIKYNGKLYLWGWNAYGGCCQNSTTNVQVPTQEISGFTDWKQVSTGQNSVTLALRSNGTIWGCGYNGNYDLGIGNNTSPILKWVQIGTDTDWVKICAVLRGGMALKSNGKLYTWGDYITNGQGGSTKTTPTQVGTDTDWTDISCGGVASYAIKGGKLYTWGGGREYSTGLNTTSDYNTPQLCNSSTDWIKLGRGSITNGHCWALKRT